MKINFNQIRDLEIIEKELTGSLAGFLAYNDNLDKVYQTAVPFVYLDKNIFVLFDNEDENYNKIVFDHNVSFGVYNERSRSEKNYNTISIKCCGNIKKVDDSKLYDEVLKIYSQKYGEVQEEILSDEQDSEENKNEKKLVIIDTEEIQAMEISGE